ncbi:hypothetical protein M409DRAFT_61044 [Zasmidium cellare ATCC 36951]|uniref:Major facilitator superfamily (MFS) profile domain-containing protein n=1 Tax=Zasmidium cellare ATCC 36951 TaxID=1080233 RepID=A0A6A6BWZ8_ZASCE|nr:uncharacterized protein M409DRAFT_61044 [Zasmidium cellare ATCC 36951]KAF2159225.1 hypothetical protein M409DRAFT_61044 [Zasmidium cellare ATCC 36951]
MATLLRPLKWFLREFGLSSIHAVGRDAYIVIACRTLRMFAHGATTLILAPFLASLSTPDPYIGLFLTLTLLGDVILGLYLTLIADTFGRRRILLLGSLLMVLTGTTFALSSNYWILLFAAVLGVVSATGTDFGPFRSIEESGFGDFDKPHAGGFVYVGLEGRWGEGEAYRVVFWGYEGVGAVCAGLVCGLSGRCEMGKGDGGGYEIVGQTEEEIDLDDDSPPANKPKPQWWSMSTISPPTFSIMSKLWALLALESLSEGMAPYALTIYYMDQKFHPSKSTLGDVTSIAYFLSASTSIFAGSLARRFGLVNTMVFTHAPSSAAIMLFSAPTSFVLTVLLLFMRTGLNNLDQAPRAAFIAAVVKPSERTAVLGIAGMLRTIAAMPGPFVTGVLASKGLFGYAFVIAGAVRLVYDASLYVLFKGLEPVREEVREGDGP